MKHPHPDRHKYRENHFWQSYSDLMAALLFIVVLVLIATILHLDLEAKETLDDYIIALTEASRDAATAESIADKLNEQSAELERIVGIREDLIEALREQFTEDELSIDEQTGAIIFNEDLLFEYRSNDLKEENKQKIQAYVKRYVTVLLSEQFRPYVAEIIIEGHSDQTGTYEDNLWHSQQRAASVANFILSEREPIFPVEQRKLLEKMITVSGRSEMDPIYYPNTETLPNPEASRRVEIQFRLKDQEMIDEMREAVS